MGFELPATETILVIAAIALTGAVVVSAYEPVTGYAGSLYGASERESTYHRTEFRVINDIGALLDDPLRVLVLNVGTRTIDPINIHLLVNGTRQGGVTYDVLDEADDISWYQGSVLQITTNGLDLPDGDHRIRVVDSSGAYDDFLVTQVQNQAPTASFTWNSPVNKDLNVDASPSTDPDGDPLSYAWDWGDGTPLGSGVTASHRYQTPGAYTVTLTVNDGKGGSDQSSQLVTV